MRLKSFAKVNLFLQILNKRPDNFHNLKTIFCRISLSDEIILSSRKDNLIKITCRNKQVPKDNTNLCYQAADLLRNKFNLKNGVNIDIKKRVPMGAGLGGGSSNAASVLLGLNKFWKLRLSLAQLAKFGASIGSDVAFFISDTKFALGTAKGEKIKPLAELSGLNLWLVLVFPNIKVSTPLIYRAWDTYSGLTIPKHNVKLFTSELLRRKGAITQEYFFNGLEPITCKLYPQVRRAQEALRKAGLSSVLMSGSGASVFGICSSKFQAQKISARLRKSYPNWQAFTVNSL